VLQHDAGEYELQSQYFSGSSYFYNCSWSPVIEQLPSGYNWTLGLDGYIKGYVKATAQVMNGYDTDIKPIKYNYLSAVKNFRVSGSVGDHPLLTWDSNVEPDLNGYKIYSQGGRLTTLTKNTTSFTDPGVIIGGGKFTPTVCYNITAIDLDANESEEHWIDRCVSAASVRKEGIELLDNSSPDKFSLSLNYPNPFNPTTNIEFAIAKDSHVKISVYNTLGEEVAILVNELKSVGTYRAMFNGKGLPSGIYYYQIIADDFIQTKKMILTK